MNDRMIAVGQTADRRWGWWLGCGDRAGVVVARGVPSLGTWS